MSAKSNTELCLNAQSNSDISIINEIPKVGI